MKCPLIILGNKKDLERYREVSEEEGKRFASNSGALFLETRYAAVVNLFHRLDSWFLFSAKEHPTVEKGFYALVREIRRFRGQKPSAHAKGSSAPPSQRNSKPPPKGKGKKKDSGCCIIS